ncbi:MAG TPA: flagellar hook-associated protein FlgL [Terriglobia bacterium]|nr:flagellar hook-associated protein FlgL [Terriglobia bacterium]
MRITDDSNYRNLLLDIQRIAERMQNAQSQVSSGKRLNRPSDDASASADVVSIDAERATNAQYLDNAASAQSRLEVADNALDGVQLVIERIRSLGQLAQSGNTPSATSTYEINQLRDQILSAANTVFEGQSIFAGSKTDGAAYVKAGNGTVSYSGDSMVTKLQTGRATSIQSQIPGDQIFSGSIDIFQTITDLMNAINTGDKAGIQTGVTNLGTLSQTVSSVRTQVGGLINSAAAAQSDLRQTELTQVAQLSRLRDADLSRALSDFSQSQIALQAATAVGARVSSISLLDYLK